MEEPERLAALYDAHAEALFRFVRRMADCEADARDVLQDVFVRVAHRPLPVMGPEGERRYLIRAAYRQFVDFKRRALARWRKHGQAAEEAETPAWPDGTAEEERMRQAAAEVLAALPGAQRSVVHLKIWEGMSFREIAEATGIPANTAASRYRYAMEKLRAALGNATEATIDGTTV